MHVGNREAKLRSRFIFRDLHMACTVVRIQEKSTAQMGVYIPGKGEVFSSLVRWSRRIFGPKRHICLLRTGVRGSGGLSVRFLREATGQKRRMARHKFGDLVIQACRGISRIGLFPWRIETPGFVVGEVQVCEHTHVRTGT